jgi:ubiquinone/menaquinone biosynthesis C-methylase UbiE
MCIRDRFYEQATIADENVSAEERVPVTLTMVPAGIGTVLDLGCGDGTILRSMDSTLFKVGLDISYTALKLAKVGHPILASSEALPFRQNAFDLLMCTEVLEHLPPIIFETALSEIRKVAKRYILISVPFDEDLSQKQARCKNCGHIFHIHLHLRSFDMSKLKKMFPDYDLKEYCFSGPLEKTVPSWVLRIRRQYGHRWEWDKNAMCPRCGHKGHKNDQPPKRTVISLITSILASITSKRHPKWISALYVKL